MYIGLIDTVLIGSNSYKFHIRKRDNWFQARTNFMSGGLEVD